MARTSISKDMRYMNFGKCTCQGKSVYCI